MKNSPLLPFDSVALFSFAAKENGKFEIAVPGNGMWSCSGETVSRECILFAWVPCSQISGVPPR